MSAEPKAEQWLAMLELVREYGDAAAEYAFHRGNGCIPTRLLDMARERLVMAGSALRGAILDAAGDPVGDTVRGDVASLIRSLHERAQQAEATRDAAQARATACEERARRAEAERDEWKACAEEGARLFVAARKKTDFSKWIEDLAQVSRWAAATLYSSAADAVYVDPSAGTGDHEGEPGRNGE